MKNLKKTLSIILFLCLVFNATAAYAAENGSSTETEKTPQSAQETVVSTDGGKEEVIYVMTDANGKTENVYVVNIYNGTEITDYGNYSSVQLLNTNDMISSDGDRLTFTTKADKAYLQGNIEEKSIPWNIEISYTLDGKQISADELAGKSGSLQIRFKVTENEKYSSFYENYALQASFTLDTKLCDNITADGGTIANVGRKKQITYTILPDKGIDTVITADVHDFEMDSVSINGIKLNLNIDVDSSELLEKITELQDGISKLNDGTGDLNSGAEKLNTGASELVSGANDLSNGAASLNDGAGKVYSGTVSLSNGAKELKSGASSLADGSAELSGGMQELYYGTTKLSNGTTELYDKTADMDTQVSEKLDSVLDSLKGTDEVISFVSEKNTDVEAVQFVIKTQAIEIPQEEAPQEQAEEKLSFWQKLLRLFGLY